MKSLIAVGIAAVVCSSSLCLAQSDSESRKQGPSAEPINAMCPIGKEPIVPSAGTVEYKGHTIGICCPSCGKNFLAWDQERKDHFIVLAAAGEEPGHAGHGEEPPAAKADAGPAQPYLLTTCPVSGQALGSMGDPVAKVYEGRQVKFCCAACFDRFEADTRGYFRQIDERFIADQLRYYPTTRCVVTDEPLFEDGEDIAKSILHEGRLVRLCCSMCRRDFRKDPAKYVAILDEKAANVQREVYPLDTCIVAGGALGSMGDPTEMVVAGRLLRFCCAMCEPKVETDPAKYIAAIDVAWEAKGELPPSGE